MNGEGGEEAPWRFALAAIAFGLLSAGAWAKHLRSEQRCRTRPAMFPRADRRGSDGSAPGARTADGFRFGQTLEVSPRCLGAARSASVWWLSRFRLRSAPKQFADRHRPKFPQRQARRKVQATSSTASSRHATEGKGRVPMISLSRAMRRTRSRFSCLIVAGVLLASCSASSDKAGVNDAVPTQRAPSSTPPDAPAAGPSGSQSTAGALPPSPRWHQVELTSAIERTGLAGNVRLGDTGGPATAHAIADADDRSVMFAVVLTLTDALEPLGDYVTTDEASLNGFATLVLDRGGVETLWFRCNDERTLEVRSTPTDRPQVEQLAAALYHELSCG